MKDSCRTRICKFFIQTDPLQASSGIIQTIEMWDHVKDAPELAGRVQQQVLQNGEILVLGTEGNSREQRGSTRERREGTRRGRVWRGESLWQTPTFASFFLHPSSRKLHARPPFLILLAIAPVADWPFRLQLLQLPYLSLDCLLLSSPVLISETGWRTKVVESG